MALRPLSKLTRLANMQVSVDPLGTRATVTIPGFSLDDIDRTGNISIWRVQKLLTAARIAAYHIPNPTTGTTFLEYDKLTADRYTFMASAHTEVARDLYSLPDDPIEPKMEAIVALAYVGTSSLSSQADIYNTKSGKLLARNVNQVVTVDKTTRKPVPIPDWWKDKYAGQGSPEGRLVVPSVEKPEKTYSYPIRVSWSDIDRYKHTNYVSYIRYCLDAAMDASMKNYFSKFHEDILNYHVKEMDISYRGESKAGDNLDIDTWENLEDPYLLHFDIKNEDTNGRNKVLWTCGLPTGICCYLLNAENWLNIKSRAKLGTNATVCETAMFYSRIKSNRSANVEKETEETLRVLITNIRQLCDTENKC